MSRRLPEALLAEYVRTGARLLHAELHSPGELSLRFDRGQLRVRVEDAGLELGLGGGAPLSPDAEALDEDDPWWTVLGQKLHGAWARIDTDQRRLAVELQFRPDDENPKIVTLEPRGPRIRARAKAKAEWDGPS